MRKYILFVLMWLLLANSAVQAIGVAADPTRLGVGARPLGMGKAFVGLADDAGAIFLNPAGLADFTGLKATSMVGKFVSEFDYQTLGGTYQVGPGVVGIGYVGSGISASLLSASFETVGDQVFIIPSTSEPSAYSFTDKVVLLSYGYPVNSDLSLGANLKLFFVDLSGPGVVGGNAKGQDLDLGLLYNPANFYSLGMNLQNVLPLTMGGKLSYGSGNEESYPLVIKLGSRFHLLGKYFALRKSDQELNLLLDYDMSLRTIPGLVHAGLEWVPLAPLALRVGVDQDVVGATDSGLAPTSNLTAGIGLSYWDFRFDYAYHQYQVFRENDTHYFSLSYSFTPGELLKILSPADRSIVHEAKLLLKGKVLDASVKKLKVQGVNTAFRSNGDFLREIFPRLKKNKVVVEALNDRGRLLEADQVRLLRLRSFSDVPQGYWAVSPVEFLATLDMISGYPDETFRPEESITRAEMCTLLIKSQEGKLPEDFKPPKFKDVSQSYGATPFIVMAADMKKVEGYPDGTFLPEGYITRAESVTMISRFFDLATPEAVRLRYLDIKPGHWAADYIAAAREAGLLTFVPRRRLEPSKPLTLGEMNQMLNVLGIEEPYPYPDYDPDENITRADICTYLFKVREKEAAEKIKVLQEEEARKAAEQVVFPDVSRQHWGAPYIFRALELNVVKGYPDGQFNPNGKITRAEGVSIISRFAKLKNERLLERAFPDLPGRHWAGQEISNAQQAGILKYLEGQNFEPNRDLTRAEVAEMLSKTPEVKAQINDLLNFENYD